MATIRYSFKSISLVLLAVIMHGAPSVGSSSDLCLPGFLCIHGVCTSGTSCQCHPGWSGVFCNEKASSNADAQTSPPPPTTTTTAISLRKTTLPTNSALMTTTTASEITTSAAQQPLNLLAAAITTTTMSMVPTTTSNDDEGGGNKQTDRKRECVPGFKCLHGVCGQGLSCTCDDGWKGVFCHIPSTPTTTGSSTNKSSVGTGTSFPIPDVTGKFKPIDGYGPLADLSLRHCEIGFECQYGNCSGIGLSCVCEPGFVGVFCHEPCPLDCGPHGKCMVKPDRCECDPMYSGTKCSVLRPLDEGQAESKSYWYAVGVCVGVVVLLLVILIVVPYLLWRRGNITMLKLVLWFQSVEEDDGRLYDAFVSYASTEEDRRFVMECLIPNLEDKMAFTLCIHERDFMPGKYITSNIMESVRQSRRTLLVISPAFVSRNWCQFEFQMAVAEMIEQKHRILPVMLGDLKEIKQESNMNDTFHRVLNTVTYLQYPGDDASDQELQRFWKRLELSMPKKVNHQAPTSPVIPTTPTSTTPLSSAHVKNGIRFPSTPQKLHGVDEIINLEPSIHSNHKNSVPIHNNHHYHNSQSSKNKNKNSAIAWITNLFRRRKNSPKRSSCVHNNSYSMNGRSQINSSITLGMMKRDNENAQTNVMCEDSDEKPVELYSGRDTDHKGQGDVVKPAQIELSGWEWPTGNTVDIPATC